MNPDHQMNLEVDGCERTSKEDFAIRIEKKPGIYGARL
jgi:hypothetical protein